MVYFNRKANHSQLLVYELLYHLHCYYCHCPDLNFLFTSTTQLHLVFNLFLQLLCVLHDLVFIQDLRHSVICEHCQLVDIAELSQTFALVLTPNTCDQNLGTLVKVNLMSSVNLMVLEVREIVCQYVHQINSTFVCVLDNFYERSIELMNCSQTDLSNQSCSFLCQWHFISWKHFIHHLLFSNFGKIFQGNSSVYVLSDISCKLLILKAFQWPETKVAWIEYEKVFKSSLLILANIMVFELTELFVAELFGNLLYFLLVDFDMFSLTDNKGWCISDKLTLVLPLVWHLALMIWCRL